MLFDQRQSRLVVAGVGWLFSSRASAGPAARRVLPVRKAALGVLSERRVSGFGF